MRQDVDGSIEPGPPVPLAVFQECCDWEVAGCPFRDVSEIERPKAVPPATPRNRRSELQSMIDRRLAELRAEYGPYLAPGRDALGDYMRQHARSSSMPPAPVLPVPNI